jgi:nucleotide-binding universal stress UspA family protein
VAYPTMVSPYLPDTVQHNALLMKQLEDDASAYLEAMRKRVDDGSRQVDTRVLVNKGPAAGILEYVAASGADFVAMASHNRHGIARFTLGSVADKVIRGSHTPVLIVHPPRVEVTARSEEVA